MAQKYKYCKKNLNKNKCKLGNKEKYLKCTIKVREKKVS